MGTAFLEEDEVLDFLLLLLFPPRSLRRSRSRVPWAWLPDDLAPVGKVLVEVWLVVATGTGCPDWSALELELTLVVVLEPELELLLEEVPEGRRRRGERLLVRLRTSQPPLPPLSPLRSEAP